MTRVIFPTTLLLAGLLAAPSADAQISFGSGGIKFGSSSFNFSRTYRPAVQPQWQPPRSPVTDHRYRGPANPLKEYQRLIVGNGPVGIAIDPPYSAPACSDGAPVIGVPPCETNCPTGPGVVPPPTEPPVPTEPEPPADPALELTYQAQDAFSAENYLLATEIMGRVLEVSPNSSTAYQFRALTHFAQANYDEAAADIYETLLRGPLWTWETVYPLYADPAIYTAQYRDLSRAAKQDPNSMAKHFLLAYHHLMLGHLEHGEKELAKVLEIQPNEPVTQKLLAAVRGRPDRATVAKR